MAFIACWNLRWSKLHFQFVWHIWFWSNCSWCMLCRSPIIWPDEGSRRCFHQKRGIMQLLKLHCTKLLSKSIWFGICLSEPKPDHLHNLRQKGDLLALLSAIPFLPSCTNLSLSSHKNTALYPRICSQKLSVSFRCKLDPWNQDVSLDRNSFLSVSNDHEKVVGTLHLVRVLKSKQEVNTILFQRACTAENSERFPTTCHLPVRWKLPPCP